MKDPYKRAGAGERRLRREDFGDPAEIGGFRGPWSGFVGTEKKGNPVRTKEEAALRRIVNKHCLAVGKERSRSAHVASLDAHSDERGLSRRHIPPTTNTMLFHDHRDMATSVHLLRNFQLALSSSLDGKVLLYSLKNRGLLTTYMGHSKAVMSCMPSTDEHRLFTASLDGYVKGWDLETGRCDVRIDTLSPLTCQTTQLADGSSFVGCLDGVIRLVDPRSKDVSRELGNAVSGSPVFGPESVFSLCAAEACSLLASTSRSGCLSFWDLRKDAVVEAREGLHSFAGFHAKKQQFIVVSGETAIFVAADSLDCVSESISVPGCSTQVLASERDMLCYGCRDGTIRVVDSDANTSIGCVSEQTSCIDWIRGLSSNLISGDILGNIKIWE